MLVCPVRAVADRAAEAADQKFLKPDHFQVQVGTAFHARQSVFRIIGRVMVARHIKQRNIQQRQQVFQVWVGQVSTPQNQLDLTKVTTGTKVVKAIDHFIADGKYFHNERIVPQNDVPCKGKSVQMQGLPQDFTTENKGIMKNPAKKLLNHPN